MTILNNIYDLIMESQTQDVKQYGFLINKRWLFSKGTKITLNKEPLEALVRARDMLPSGYNFMIFYGHRTDEEQLQIVKSTEKELKKTHPDNWEELLIKYTGGYGDITASKATPVMNGMNHLSGKAVDLTLALNGKEVDMGLDSRGVAKMDASDKLGYYKTGPIADNRKLLKKVLEKNGFKNYKDEWWHWGYMK
jgi:zinc D-Ala-D-Ala dipeptidase